MRRRIPLTATELVDLDRLRRNWIAGACSDIPVCCRLFYLAVWEPVGLVSRAAHSLGNSMLRFREATDLGQTKFGMIPCPYHFCRGGILLAKECAPGCICDAGSKRRAAPINNLLVLLRERLALGG